MAPAIDHEPSPSTERLNGKTICGIARSPMGQSRERRLLCRQCGSVPGNYRHTGPVLSMRAEFPIPDDNNPIQIQTHLQ
jgi:hypothetical protein